MNNFILMFFLFFVPIANAAPEILNNELPLNKKEMFIAQSKSLNELEAEESLDKLNQHLSEMGKLWDIKYTECYRAVGNDKF
ncbi:hypothetical protein FOG18_13670 (plasmid) [Legionella israelensis]|uniref:hypothetical protein n=1 Tax=Legionella israelensis TaxID=454 RepID=UPI00118060E9|nr:hypothetical protein [Legionella israelensis]QDP73704.1 hypothetical protein FOG18_13670 [Legionella israelensis]